MSYTYISDHSGIVRKPHICRVCGSTIQKGERCRIYRGVESSEGFYTSYFHEPCWEATRHWSADDWEMYNPGDLSLQEILQETDHEPE